MLPDGIELVPLADVVEQEIARRGEFGPFHRHWLMHRAPEKVREHLARAATSRVVAARQGFASMDLNDAPTAAFSARNTSASELNILGDTISSACPQSMINQFCAIPANDARAGKVYHVEAGGIYSNTSTPTIIWTPRWGSSTTVATNISLGASGTWTSITSTTNLPWYTYLKVIIRTAPPGTTVGTAYATGVANMGIPVTSSQFVAQLYMGGGTAATTIDTSGQGTAGCGITLNWTWGASSASNSFTTQWFVLRSQN